MNIGIRLHDTAPGTLKDRLSFAREQGFSCAHLALSKAVEGFAMGKAPQRLTQDFAARVRADFEDTQMECAVLGCYLNLADPDPERRARTQEIYKAHLRFSGWIGARVVGTETPANPDSRFSKSPSQSEEAFQLFIDSLRPVVRYAEEVDAILAVEPVHSHIVSTPERAQRMLEEVPSDHLQIILDTVNLVGPGHDGQVDEILSDAIGRWGDRVRVLHMKDFTVLPDGSIHSQACGTGVMRYEKLLDFGMAHDLPMTLEDTKPDNAEQARLHLEKVAASLKA